ncbi:MULTISPECIES: DUF6879 family protein [Nocardiopsis]|jgi:hypothetical protein|uniref:DUF6879 family protein n=1 Tax=Nocardiopsis TaxID=2013 RepID=UPI0005A8346E|nr:MULTISPECIES: DUF6879 family protein [Nocardiopsis]MEC3895966.1 hypothetical protein [Nocardiopsis sp. LDBS1602]
MRITQSEFDEIFESFDSECLHMEMRDSYGTQSEIEPFAKWVNGEVDDFEWMSGWCDTLRRGVNKGKVFRRALVVSEPLSEYQKWAHSTTTPLVEAGEDIRWVSRRRVSSMALPGNDFYLIDGKKVIFMHYSGEGAMEDILVSVERSDVELCRSAFESVWPLAIPHAEYRVD